MRRSAAAEARPGARSRRSQCASSAADARAQSAWPNSAAQDLSPRRARNAPSAAAARARAPPARAVATPVAFWRGRTMSMWLYM